MKFSIVIMLMATLVVAPGNPPNTMQYVNNCFCGYRDKGVDLQYQIFLKKEPQGADHVIIVDNMIELVSKYNQYVKQLRADPSGEFSTMPFIAKKKWGTVKSNELSIQVVWKYKRIRLMIGGESFYFSFYKETGTAPKYHIQFSEAKNPQTTNGEILFKRYSLSRYFGNQLEYDLCLNFVIFVNRMLTRHFMGVGKANSVKHLFSEALTTKKGCKKMTFTGTKLLPAGTTPEKVAGLVNFAVDPLKPKKDAAKKAKKRRAIGDRDRARLEIIRKEKLRELERIYGVSLPKTKSLKPLSGNKGKGTRRAPGKRVQKKGRQGLSASVPAGKKPLYLKELIENKGLEFPPVPVFKKEPVIVTPPIRNKVGTGIETFGADKDRQFRKGIDRNEFTQDEFDIDQLEAEEEDEDEFEDPDLSELPGIGTQTVEEGLNVGEEEVDPEYKEKKIRSTVLKSTIGQTNQELLKKSNIDVKKAKSVVKNIAVESESDVDIDAEIEQMIADDFLRFESVQTNKVIFSGEDGEFDDTLIKLPGVPLVFENGIATVAPRGTDEKGRKLTQSQSDALYKKQVYLFHRKQNYVKQMLFKVQEVNAQIPDPKNHFILTVYEDLSVDVYRDDKDVTLSVVKRLLKARTYRNIEINIVEVTQDDEIEIDIKIQSDETKNELVVLVNCGRIKEVPRSIIEDRITKEVAEHIQEHQLRGDILKRLYVNNQETHFII